MNHSRAIQTFFSFLIISFANAQDTDVLTKTGDNLKIKNTFFVKAMVETEPCHSKGTSADDIAIWVNSKESSKSKVIGTDKHKGLMVYDLEGHELFYYKGDRMNNVDIIYDFPFQEGLIDIAVTSNRGKSKDDDVKRGISVFKINKETGELENITLSKTIESSIKTPYGLSLYKSKLSNKSYAILCGKKENIVEQWELYEDKEGLINGRLIRSWEMNNRSEGMVVDSELGYLYLAEEPIGIWKYNLEPRKELNGELVVTVSDTLQKDIEGLTIVRDPHHRDLLLASSQGNSCIIIFDLITMKYIARFFIVANEEDKIDEINHQDGIESTSVYLNEKFPKGIFVLHDYKNMNGAVEVNQNFKFVSLKDILTFVHSLK